MRRNFLKTALPLTASALASNLLGAAGAVLLPQRLMAAGYTKSQALSALGVISGVALPLVLTPMALVSSVCTVLVPATAEATARGDRKRLRRLADKSVRTVGMLGLPLTAILVPLAPTLSRLFFGQTVTVQTVAALGAACILSDYQAVFGSMLNGLGCQKRLVAASVCGECVQLAMLYVLCARPALGVNGYLIALLVGALCTAALEAGMLRGLGLPMLCFDRLRDPLLVGITLLFWTRALYWGMLSLLGGQFQAVVLTLCASGLLFCACLTALGYPVRRYLSVYRGKIPINSFFLC